MPTVSNAAFNAALAPKAQLATVDTELKLGRFTDAWQFTQVFFPATEPYRWQMETQMQLSGYPDPYDPNTRVEFTAEAPLLYTLCAANGSGKDQIVLANWALFCICTKRRFHWIGTSSSYTQLDQQTWRHIKERAEEINRVCGKGFLDIKKHNIRCSDSGAEITLYRTDESGKTEGWHPLAEGAPMAIVLNECKSLEEEIVVSFKRCHGYTHWLNISSPGLVQRGYFFRKQLRPEVSWPDKLVPGKEYFRRIDWRDCPHLEAEYQRDVREFGEDSAYILSSYKAIYPASTAEQYVVPPHTLHYPAPALASAPRRAGVDLSGGGDATAIYVLEGNRYVTHNKFTEPHGPTLARRVAAYLREQGVPPEFALADAGHLGKTIIDMIRENGYAINGVYNNSKARNPKVYLNRGAELAFNVRHLVLKKILDLTNIPTALQRQLGERLYEFTESAKIKLEDKKAHRARHGHSPDDFDAFVLANAFVHPAMFQSAPTPQEQQQKRVSDLMDMWNRVYGEHDKHRAAAGAYRTTGIYSGRYIGATLPNARKRFR